MVASTFEILTKSGCGKITHMFQETSWDRKNTYVIIDRWFWEQFAAAEITFISLEFRQSLKGDVSKVLYRFLSSNDGTGIYKIKTLVACLGIDVNQPDYKKRQTLKNATGIMSV